MNYYIVQAIHIIFVVSYFAGLFYIVRLFVYHTEALDEEEPKRSILSQQYIIMEQKLWDIITVPAFSIMLITGGIMLYLNPGLIQLSWFHVKLTGLVFLFIYHFWCFRTVRKLQKNKSPYTSVQLRMLNEVATLLLFLIVFAVILKSSFIDYWYWLIISFIGAGIIIMAIVKIINSKKV